MPVVVASAWWILRPVSVPRQHAGRRSLEIAGQPQMYRKVESARISASVIVSLGERMEFLPIPDRMEALRFVAGRQGGGKEVVTVNVRHVLAVLGALMRVLSPSRG